MPTNRILRTRKMVNSSISDILRCYLQTGDLFFSQASFPHSEGQFELFQLCRNRAELKKIWLENRAEILADLERAGAKRGSRGANACSAKKPKRGKAMPTNRTRRNTWPHRGCNGRQLEHLLYGWCLAFNPSDYGHSNGISIC